MRRPFSLRHGAPAQFESPGRANRSSSERQPESPSDPPTRTWNLPQVAMGDRNSGAHGSGGSAEFSGEDPGLSSGGR